jgi:hypothetical protein
MIDIFVIMFVVMFNHQGTTSEMSLRFDTVEQCFEHKRKVDKDPTSLELPKIATDIEYGCVRYLKNYVEECEQLPMDYVNKKECIPYWDHWGSHSRSERGTFRIEE